MRLIARRLADNHNAGTTRVSRINNGLCAPRRTCRIIVSAFFYREIFINITRTRLSRFFILMQQKASRLLLRRGIDLSRSTSLVGSILVHSRRPEPSNRSSRFGESNSSAFKSRFLPRNCECCAAEASSDRSLRNVIEPAPEISREWILHLCLAACPRSSEN